MVSLDQVDQPTNKALLIKPEDGTVIREIMTDALHASGITYGNGALWIGSTKGKNAQDPPKTLKVDPMTGMGTIGTTTNTNVPSKFRPAVIGRVGINRGGIKGYQEADLEGGPLRFGVVARRIDHPVLFPDIRYVADR